MTPDPCTVFRCAVRVWNNTNSSVPFYRPVHVLHEDHTSVTVACVFTPHVTQGHCLCLAAFAAVGHLSYRGTNKPKIKKFGSMQTQKQSPADAATSIQKQMSHSHHLKLFFILHPFISHMSRSYQSGVYISTYMLDLEGKSSFLIG